MVYGITSTKHAIYESSKGTGVCACARELGEAVQNKVDDGEYEIGENEPDFGREAEQRC